jgi:hypothetical protein
VLIDAKPRMPGDCRDCHLLCVDCRAEMGDLNQKLEELKQKNRAFNKAYQKIDDDLEASNQKFYKALTNITGEQDGSKGCCSLEGLSGSLGNFSSSLLGFASNFTGTGKTTRLIDKKWFATGGTIVSNGAGIYGTASGRSNYNSNAGIADEVANWTGISMDFLTSDFWKWLNETLKTMDEIGVTSMIEDFFNFKRFNIDQSPVYKLTPADIEGLGRIALLSDIWSLARSSYILVNDLTDLWSSYTAASDAERELQKILDEILYNNALMACIRETQDFLNKGGPKVIRTGNKVSWGMAVSLIAPAIISSNHKSLTTFSKNDFFKSRFIIDEVKLKSAISTLKQLINVEKQNETVFAKKIFPAFFPWITGKWKNYEPRTLIQRLQKAKEPFQNLSRKCDEMTRLYRSIKTDLQYVVIFERQISDGSDNIQNSPLSEYTDGFYLAGHENETENISTEKWLLASNKKIPADKGSLNLIFPANVEWSVDILTSENKFYTNRSSYSKHTSYDLAPGNYNFRFNSIPIENVPVEKGKETRFRLGILNIISKGTWNLSDESKKKYYTSGNKPVKMAFPVGTYQFTFEEKTYRIQIKEGVVLKFDLRKPFVIEQ